MRCDLVGLILVGSLATQVLAQAVTLPNGTGQIAPPAGWTVLQQAELEMASRATDPTMPVSRATVLAVIEDLRTQERTAQNVLLHRQGPGTDELQLINCYSADVVVSSEDLLAKEACEQIRDAIIEQMSSDQQQVKCTGLETSQLWALPSLAMQFEHEDPNSKWRLQMQIVPAGDHLQYFEGHFVATDTTARQNFHDALATFDGAKEPDSRASNLLIGGLAGAVAGILTALFRRKRQQQRMSAAGSQAGPG